MDTRSISGEKSRIFEIPLLRSHGHTITIAQMLQKDYEQESLGMMKSVLLEYSSDSTVKERNREEESGN